MAFRSVTQPIYDKLLAAYREKPGDHAHAGARAGIDPRTAVRGWEKGWILRSRKIDFPAIKPIVERETFEALARLKQTEEERAASRKVSDNIEDRAREAAIEAKKQVQELLIAAGRIEGSAMTVIGRLLSPLVTMADQLAKAPAELLALPLDRRLRVMSSMMRNVALLQQSMRDYQQSVRLHFGDPNAILGVQITDDRSVDEMLADIEKAYSETKLLKAQLDDDGESGEGSVTASTPTAH